MIYWENQTKKTWVLADLGSFLPPILPWTLHPSARIYLPIIIYCLALCWVTWARVLKGKSYIFKALGAYCYA